MPESSDARERSWFRRSGEALVRACIATALNRKWLVIAVALLLTGIAGYASTQLKISTETKDILSGDLQFFQIESRYREVFPQPDRIIVVIDANSPDAARAAAGDLAEILRRDIGQLESVEVPGASPYFQRNALLFLGADRLRTLTEQLGQSQPVLSIFAKDPSLRGLAQFLGLAQLGVQMGRDSPELARTLRDLAETTSVLAEGKSATTSWNALLGGGEAGRNRALVLIDPVVSEPSLFGSQPALAQVRAAISDTEAANPAATMRVTGLPELRQQELNQVFSGALYASVLSFVLVTLSLFLIRSWRIVVALVAALAIGSIITTVLAAVSVGRLNLISITFLVLFFGLGVDFGTHFGLRYLEAAKAGAPFQAAMMRAALGEAPGITLSALCASIGFLSFVPTAYVGLAEFGIISALGMLVAVVVTFTVFPSLMAVIPPKPGSKSEISIGVGLWIRRYDRAILVVALIVTVAAAFVAPRIRLDVNPLNLQNPESEAVRTYRDLADDPATSPYALNAIAPNLDAARELACRLAGLEGVAEVLTIESLVPDDQAAKLEVLRETARRLAPVFEAQSAGELGEAELQKAFAELRAKASQIAAAGGDGSPSVEAARALAAALDRFAQMRGESPSALRELDRALTGALPALIQNLQQLLSVSAPVTSADMPADLRRDWVAPDGRLRIQILPAHNLSSTQNLAVFARNVQAVAPEATGVPVNITEAGAAVARSFVQAIGYTVAAVAIVILVLRRSFVDVVLVLAPLAVASLWTLAGAVLLGLELNFANVIVVPLLIGLGVASSIHMVVRSRQALGSGGGDAGRRDVLDTSTPLAVFVAQLNTAAAFATLAIAEHRGLFSMGVLLGLSIVFVLIASLVVLPAAMIEWRRWRRASRHATARNP
jgi:hopanoid biosynthesis associated RND transporter like protein HpnN